MKEWEKEFEEKFKENVLIPNENYGSYVNMFELKNFIRSLLAQQKHELLAQVREIVGGDEKLPQMELQPYLWTERNARNYQRKELRAKLDELEKKI